MELHYDKSVDWWTLGILMFEMLTGDVSIEWMDLIFTRLIYILSIRHLFVPAIKRRPWMPFKTRNYKCLITLHRMPKIFLIEYVL